MKLVSRPLLLLWILLCTTSCAATGSTKGISYPASPFLVEIPPNGSLRASVSAIANQTALCLGKAFPNEVTTDFNETPTITILIQENGLPGARHDFKLEYRLDLEFLLDEIPPEGPIKSINLFPRIITRSSAILVGRNLRANFDQRSITLLQMEREATRCINENSRV